MGIAFAAYDLIKASGANIITIAAGDCSSAAIAIFCSGKHRIVTPNTSFLFHRIRIKLDNVFTSDEIENQARNLRAEETRYKDLIASACPPISPHDITALMENEKRVDAEEAVQLGIAQIIATWE